MYDQEWELDEFVGFLRAVRDGRELPWPAYECSLIYMTLSKPDAQGVLQLTPAGKALLDLLEAEHFKRRIEAAGWKWCDGPYVVSGLDPVGIAPCGSLVWEEFPTLEAAAEYAEAQAQGVPE
jgi:hypothetical protein